MLVATVADPLADVQVIENAPQSMIPLGDHFDDPEIEGTVISFDTVLGAIRVGLFDALVPLTVANFLNYVLDGDLVDSFIHRALPGFVIQGGGFTFVDAQPDVASVVTDPPVVNEFNNHAVASGVDAVVTQDSATVQLPAGTDLSAAAAAGQRVRLVGRDDGLPDPSNAALRLDFFDIIAVDDETDTIEVSPTPTSATQALLEWFIFPDVNGRGTISPPKQANAPDSGTSGFFFSLANNSSNLDIQNEGFAAFGEVLFDDMTVVDAIVALQIINAGGSFTTLPVRDYDGGTIFKENLVIVNSVDVVSELAFEVLSNSNPDLVAASIDPAGTLTLDFAADTHGLADITVRATDLQGITVEDTFNVFVEDDGLTAPEITVQHDGNDVVSDDNVPIDLGQVVTGDPGDPGPTAMFTVQNDGDDDLTLGAPMLPVGFTLTEPLDAVIGAGNSDTFTIELDSADVGLKGGLVSIDTNDGDEDPFNIFVTGLVTFGADDFEVDDTAASANAIDIDGTAQTHSLHVPTDVDFVTFTITGLSDVVIETDGVGGVVGETTITLFGPDDLTIEIASADDGGSGSFTVLERTGDDALPPGTYAVRVNETDLNGFVELYSLSVTADKLALVLDIDNDDIRSIAFTDDDGNGEGTTATITMRKGSAKLTFEGDFLDSVNNRGRVTVTGQNVRLVLIDMRDTENRATLSIRGRGGDGFIDVVDMTSDGDVGSILARIVNLKGDIDIDGALLKLQLHDIDTNHTLRVGTPIADNPRAALTIDINSARNTALISDIGVSSIRTREGWDNSAPDNAEQLLIDVPWLGRANFGTGVFVDMLISGINAPRGVALASVRAREDIEGGEWTVESGNVGTIAANAIAQGWRGRFADADVKSIKAKADASVDLEAGSAASITANGRIHDSRIILTDEFADRAKALGKLSARDVIERTTVRTLGTIGSIAALAIEEGRFYAGYDLLLDETIRLPDFAADFAAAISRVNLKRRDAAAFVDTILAAGEIGRTRVNIIEFDNANGEHGFVASRIAGIDGATAPRPGGDRIRLTRLEDQVDADDQIADLIADTGVDLAELTVRVL